MRNLTLRDPAFSGAATSFYALAGTVPAFDVLFAENKSLTNVISGQDLITVTRSSTKTVRGANAPILVPAGVAAFENDPVTGESLGVLIEESRIQLLQLTDTLSTQTKTVTAAAHTLSFYGTGTITLSGAHSATVTGVGNYPARRTFTFTPSAGSLNLAVEGSIRYAQLEAGGFATSYIPNTGTGQVIRNADVLQVTGVNFSSWYRQDEGTLFVETRAVAAQNTDGISGGGAVFSNGTNNERIRVNVAAIQAIWVAGGVTQASLSSGSGFVANASYRAAAATRVNNLAFTINGNTVQTGSAGTVPSVSQLNIGMSNPTTGYLNGTIRRLTYWPARLPDPNLRAITF